MSNSPEPSPSPRIASRVILGALAGMAGTMAMTVAMGRFHRRLPAAQQYPLPPREITEVITGGGSDETIKDAATVAHFLYGAATGSVLAVVRPKAGLTAGALYGVGIWATSYFGWVPITHILKPANRHPDERNALMIGVHLIWGAVTALSLRELIVARVTMLRAGPLRDRNSL